MVNGAKTLFSENENDENGNLVMTFQFQMIFFNYSRHYILNHAFQGFGQFILAEKFLAITMKS